MSLPKLNPLAAAGETARRTQTIKDAIAQSESLGVAHIRVHGATIQQVASAASDLGYHCDWAEFDDGRIEFRGFNEPGTEEQPNWRLILDAPEGQ